MRDDRLPHRLRSLLRKPSEKPKRANASVSVMISGPSDAWQHEDYLNYFEAVALYLGRHDGRAVYDFRKHESGPELIVYLALGTAGITLAKSVIDFVTTLIKARSEGIKRGDEPANPIEIVVRRYFVSRYGGGDYEEEYALRIPANAAVRPEAIEEAIVQAITRAGDKIDLRLSWSPWQAEIAQFADPVRVYSCEDVLAVPSPVPVLDGVYGWWFGKLPPLVVADGCRQHQGLRLLYAGISPNRPPRDWAPRGATSTLLWERIKYHYTGNAEGSTLRKSLGCLLADELGIQLRRVGSGHRMTFVEGEQALSAWMAENTYVSWVVQEWPWQLESDLIAALDLPLNLQGNKHNRFHSVLTAARARCVAQAETLPVVPNPGIGGRRRGGTSAR